MFATRAPSSTTEEWSLISLSENPRIADHLPDALFVRRMEGRKDTRKGLPFSS